MEPVNWVQAKADCVIEVLFDGALFDQISRDADIATSRLSDPKGRSPFEFKVTKLHQNHFPIIEVEQVYKGSTMPVRTVRIVLDRLEDKIVAHPYQGDAFEITKKWDDEMTTCNVYMNGEPCELWKISKAALDNLFFGKG